MCRANETWRSEVADYDVKKFLERLEEQGLEPYSYSGRFMYGQHCPAVNVESIGEFLACIFQVGMELGIREPEADDEFDLLLRGTRSDQMGLGMVYYWPEVEWDGRE